MTNKLRYELNGLKPREIAEIAGYRAYNHTKKFLKNYGLKIAIAATLLISFSALKNYKERKAPIKPQITIEQMLEDTDILEKVK
jgi:hypothetical protein